MKIVRNILVVGGISSFMFLSNLLAITQINNDLIINDGEKTGLRLFASTRGTLFFCDGAGNDRGKFQYHIAPDILTYKNPHGEVFRIDASRNFSIGTTWAGERFNVGGDIYVLGSGDDIAGTNIENSFLRVGGTLGLDPDELYFNCQGNIGTIGEHDLIFNTNSSRKMTLTSAGNVGIGVTSPSEKLEVAGNTKLTGNLAVIGDSAIDGSLEINGKISVQPQGDIPMLGQ